MIVSNSTPLINFAAIRRLDILEAMFTTLYIPKAVEHELLERGKQYPSTTEIQQVKFLVTQDVQNVMLRDALTIDLDIGEAEAITLALEHKAELLLLDEITGRITAESYKIPFTGSIGCLIEAKRIGIIPAVKPLLDAMQKEARFWVNHHLYTKILNEQSELQ